MIAQVVAGVLFAVLAAGTAWTVGTFVHDNIQWYRRRRRDDDRRER